MNDPGGSVIRIDLNAAYIWPLLAPHYSISEKTAVSFFVGNEILHELAVSIQTIF
jgi:hypothetical protein